MRSFRHNLRLWAALWFVAQVASVSALVPRDCCAAHRPAAATPKPSCHQDAAATRCPMRATNGTPCPMHRGDAGTADQASTDACAMRSTCSGPMAALVAQLSNYGVLPTSPQLVADLDRGALTVGADQRLVCRLAAPDPPPPRA